MHHFIFPTKDSWISSGSSHIDGTSYTNQNYGQDEILELKKQFWNRSFDYPTRTLLQFDFASISSSLTNGTIRSVPRPRWYLRLYESEGNKELSSKYILTAHPLSQSWDEGTGKFGDNPKTTFHPKIKKANDPYIPFNELEMNLKNLSDLLNKENISEVKNLLQKLIKSYKSNSEIVDHIYTEQVSSSKIS